jgi:Spy/CpxP family protein refolding chaperone
MNGRWNIRTLAAVALVAALAGTAGAQRMHGPMGGRGGPGFGPPPMEGDGPPRRPGLEALEQLDLSDAQRDRVRQLVDDERRRTIPLQADVRMAELDLEQALEADKPDAAAVDRLADRIAGLRGSMMKSHLKTRLAVHALLTPAQRTKLRRLVLQGPRDGDGPPPR